MFSNSSNVTNYVIAENGNLGKLFRQKKIIIKGVKQLIKKYNHLFTKIYI